MFGNMFGTNSTWIWIAVIVIAFLLLNQGDKDSADCR